MNGATTGGSSISGEPLSSEPCTGTYVHTQPPTAADAGLSEQDDDAYAAQAPALVALLISKAWPKGRNTTSIPLRVSGTGTSVINTTALIDTGSDISAMSLAMATSTALKGVPLQPLQAGDFKAVAGVEQGNGVKLTQARPITSEREALKVRSKITAAGGTLVLTQAEHGAAGALVTMEDIVVKRGTKLTVNLRSTVVPKLAVRSAAIVTPTQA
jgi:hypothetical protein